MKRKAIIEDGFAILPGAKAIVTGGGLSKKSDAAKDQGVKPYDLNSYPFSIWGDDNLFPQNVLEDLKKNDIAAPALRKRQRVHYGRGIIAYRDGAPDQNGDPKREQVKDQQVLDFFRINRINFQWPDLIFSLETFYNGWLEFITNKGQDQINRVFTKDPAYCRMAKIDEKTYKIASLYYSAQWERRPDIDNKEKVVTIPMWDDDKYDGTRYADPKFIKHLFYRTFNTSYYHLSEWNAVRANKWMEIANKVPQLKAAIMKNQMTIKYHVTIPYDYFEKKYPAPDYTPQAREKKIQEVLDDLNDFLSDVENSGKSFVSFAFYDKVAQKLQEGWKITPIEDKLQDGQYLPDSGAANSEILFAIQVDPCLIGSGIPGGKLGAGSGSDKREAYWGLNADMGASRQISLEPLYFIRDFNRWDPTINFDYVVVDTSQTQDQHPTKKEKRIDQNQV